MNSGWSSDWYNDRFSDDDFHFAPCRHRHVVPVTIGRRRFVEGEVWDDIRIHFQCTDCLEYVSEPEVRSAWNGQSIEEGSTSQLGDEFEEDVVSDREEVKACQYQIEKESCSIPHSLLHKPESAPK